MAKQTNEMRYKTAEDRVKAFLAHRSDKTSIVAVVANEFAHWLALEAENERLENCPFCHGKMQLMFEQNNNTHRLVCYGGCGYTTGAYASESEAISWLGRIARAVRAAKEGGVK